MRITHLKTNRIVNPLGFALERPSLSWIVEDTPDRIQTAAQVIVGLDPALGQVVWDSGKVAGGEIDSLGHRPPITLAPRTRYYWRVRVWGETEQAESETAWFETAKMDEPWQAMWITPAWEDREQHPYLFRRFDLPARAVWARAYVCGLGLYRLELNGQPVGDEVLTPGCNAYDHWFQYQTYDLTDQLLEGDNLLTAMLGNGWYKGRYGPGQFGENKAYGDRFALICELRVRLEDGQELVLGSDATWQAAPAPVRESSIYDGEVYDARIPAPTIDTAHGDAVELLDLPLERLEARRSLPIRVMEEIKPAALIHTPAGETVLDMGQNMVGWLRFRVAAPAGTEIYLQHGEVLQEGNFYRENLRSAKAEYTYIANGEETVAEPRFTFYGFRYCKVSGWPGELDPDDFTGCVVYSDMDLIGELETSNAKVNQLIQNVLWGQKGNFVDIPTDCPQRDERLGWTGDTQVFSGTACYNMDAAAFFAKYLYDLAKEQAQRGGMVPHYVPSTRSPGGGSAAWGDVATIVPWNVYTFYGDRAILEQQFESMRGWVEWIKAQDEAAGGKRLWTTGFHFGDWLALDGDDPDSPMGGTPEDYIASAYYYHSTMLVARAAAVLGRDTEAATYQALADEIRAAFQREYLTPTGRLAINTQTAYVLALYMDLVPDAHRARIVADLRARLMRDKVHLRTGFVGTPYICRVLSAHGANDLAYRLLLNEDYPSWLYAVNLGATTIWERWNSLNPDGSISSTGMNSLNHYAYGSIVEWMYRDMCGLNPTAGDDNVAGFRHARIAPKPHHALQHARARYRSAAGWYESGWRIDADGGLQFDLAIPFGARATVALPDASREAVRVNGQPALDGRQVGDTVELELGAGRYAIAYQPTKPYYEVFSSYTPVARLLQHAAAREILTAKLPAISQIPEGMLARMGEASLRDLVKSPFVDLSEDELTALDELLGGIRA